MAAPRYYRYGTPPHYEMESRSIQGAVPIARQVGVVDGGVIARIVSHSTGESFLSLRIYITGFH